MLVYDYVEINKEMFFHIIDNKEPYKVNSSYGHTKSFYNSYGQTVVKIHTDSSNECQYFINSAHPV